MEVPDGEQSYLMLSLTMNQRLKFFGRKRDNWTGYFGKLMRTILIEATKTVKGTTYYHRDTLESLDGTVANLGGRMQRHAEEMHMINDEAKESLAVLRGTFNDIVKIEGVLDPQMIKMMQRIRDTRMSVTIELNKALRSMKEVRSFFMESDYKVEMERLERFVVLAERFKVVIEDGTMDAITDVMIKLAIAEEGAE